MALQKVDYEVLDAASDDWESIEDIFLFVRFDLVTVQHERADGNAMYWRERNKEISLWDIARSIDRMVQSGRMFARLEDGTITPTPPKGLCTECWYKTTDAGRSELEGIELP